MVHRVLVHPRIVRLMCPVGRFQQGVDQIRSHIVLCHEQLVRLDLVQDAHTVLIATQATEQRDGFIEAPVHLERFRLAVDGLLHHPLTVGIPAQRLKRSRRLVVLLAVQQVHGLLIVSAGDDHLREEQDNPGRRQDEQGDDHRHPLVFRAPLLVRDAFALRLGCLFRFPAASLGALLFLMLQFG